MEGLSGYNGLRQFQDLQGNHKDGDDHSAELSGHKLSHQSWCQLGIQPSESTVVGGMFERMIQTANRCLKRVIGNYHLTYEELLTLVTEVEMILNSIPVLYVSSEDLEELLTA